MIKLSNVSFSYGEKSILQNFSLNISKMDSIIKITGNSGTGKSTLAKIIAGEIKIDSGHINVTGNTLYLPQNAKQIFVPGETIEKVINSLPDKLIIQKFHQNLKIMKLDWKIIKDLTPEEISGGESQKLLLAIGFALNSDIIIIDETTSAMDKKSVEDVLKLFADYSGNIIIIDHKNNFYESIYQKIIKV
jgi:ATPase subunit of ABC transporter with duplicated ATPase domains